MTLHDDRPTISPEELSQFIGEVFITAPFPQVKGVKVRTDLPVLDADLLSDIVYWAYLNSQTTDEGKTRSAKALALLKERFSGWGRWYQGAWAAKLPRSRRKNGERRPIAKEEAKCSSAFCIAGQAVVQRGYVMLADSSGGADYCVTRDAVKPDRRGIKRVTDKAVPRQISDVATEALGLTEHESAFLFNAGNRITGVVSMACYIARRRGQDLYLPQEVLDLDAAWDDQVSGVASILTV